MRDIQDSERRSVEETERLAAVGQLSAEVAHELNNPLDGIMRAVGLAQRNLHAGQIDDVERLLRDALFGLQRMAEVVRELLELGRAHGPAAAAELPYLAQQAVATLAPAAQANHVTVVVGPLPDVSVPANLYQVLVNLIKNAIDAQPQGGAVRVDARINQRHLELEVADTGPGVPEDDLTHIFEPFFTRKDVGMGTGLGLAVCKELIARMEGVILARNQPDCGCEFVMRIPLGERAVEAGSALPGALR